MVVVTMMVEVEVNFHEVVVVRVRSASSVGNLVIGQGNAPLVEGAAGFLLGTVVVAEMIAMEVGQVIVVAMVSGKEVLIARENAILVTDMLQIAMVTAMVEKVVVGMIVMMLVEVLVMEVVGQLVLKEITEIVLGLMNGQVDAHLMMIAIKSKYWFLLKVWYMYISWHCIKF